MGLRAFPSDSRAYGPERMVVEAVFPSIQSCPAGVGPRTDGMHRGFRARAGEPDHIDGRASPPSFQRPQSLLPVIADSVPFRNSLPRNRRPSHLRGRG
jgi:hypothetical protein